MTDLMIDIETLGTKPGSVILSIAAVEFDLKTGKTGSIFYQDIDLDSCVKQGLSIDVSTVLWWLEQPKEIQNTIIIGHRNQLKNVLRRFGMWISDNTPKDVKIWGNSARFDLGLLEAAYDSCNMRLPWNHYNECDVRTIVMFAPDIKKEMKFEGIKHNPIYDCKHQIRYCSKIYQTLNFPKDA
ncbi:3'-5' exoribonuclease [Polaribacter sp. MSW13]|uniref:3'-5' exoribonuclease n=1 Tax=Polaribacter marinus TaxID=2916838 RepID=A0A9X1VU26_9FLAO|nr:3'-5' exonuclease [Polaribacter marinus]MCI2229561.1 3'-5' exoribonuclease [Polaribacter marinus]